MPIDKHRLPSLSQRQRFLEELEEHSEDSGDTKSLGTNEELIEIFTMYTQTLRQQQRKFIALFAVSLLAFEIVCDLALTISNINSVWGQITIALLRTIGLPVYLPFMVMFGRFVGAASTENDLLFLILMRVILPLIVVAFWTTLATLIRFPPRILTRRFTQV